MYNADQSVSDRRTTLIAAALRIQAEAGADNVALVDPALTIEIMRAVADDVAHELDARLAGGICTVEQLADVLLEGTLTAQRPWNDALRLIAVSLERVTDFADHAAMVGPWHDAVVRAVTDAQERGLVNPAIDAEVTARVLRDTMQRAVQYGLRYGRESYMEHVNRLLVAALRPAAD